MQYPSLYAASHARNMGLTCALCPQVAPDLVLWIASFDHGTDPGANEVTSAFRQQLSLCLVRFVSGSNPDSLDVHELVDMVRATFAPETAHLVAAERYRRIHHLVAVDPY
ncbi:hypothetical protein D3C72_1775280 [compost metagenome]